MSPEYVQQLLQQFSEKIEPYSRLWGSVRTLGFALQEGEAWLSLAVRVLLSEVVPDTPKTVSPVADFLAYRFDCPLSSLSNILGGIVVEGAVPIEAKPFFVKAYLTRVIAGLATTSVTSVTWFAVLKHDREYSLREFGVCRPCISLTGWGERMMDLLNVELLQRVDSALRLQEPPYDGLSDLASKWIPGAGITRDSSQAVIQVIAPLPFDLVYHDTGNLIVQAPFAARDATLKVRCFFRPGGESSSQVVKLQESAEGVAPGAARWEYPVEWPSGAERAKILLFFTGQEVDSIEVNRWPESGSLRAAVDIFFDPEHRRLRESLLGQDSKSSQNFELAVVRLLNLLGIPLIWYGKGSTQSRPDVAAGLLLEGKSRVIVLGECTRETPAAKFSGLAERARQLRDHCAGEAEVLPVVFTRVGTTESEVQQAAEYGVSLLGRSDLEVLVSVLGTPVRPTEVIQYLRTLRPAYFPGVRARIAGIERWKSRW